MVFAPWRASATALARPIPRLPPVMKATFPERSNIVRSWDSVRSAWNSGAAVFTTDSVEVKDKLACSVRNLKSLRAFGPCCCAASSSAKSWARPDAQRRAPVSRDQKLSSFLDAFLVVHGQDAHPLVDAFDETREHFAGTELQGAGHAAVSNGLYGGLPKDRRVHLTHQQVGYSVFRPVRLGIHVGDNRKCRVGQGYTGQALGDTGGRGRHQAAMKRGTDLEGDGLELQAFCEFHRS